LETLRSGLLLVAFFYLFQLSAGFSGSAFSGYFLVNSYTTTFKLLTLLSGLFVLHNSEDYIRRHERHLLEYPIVLSLALLLMLLLVSSGHLISAFLALVGFSLNIYVLILFDAPTAVSREAGIKYFYLSAFSSGLFIYGIFLLFLVTGTGHFYEIATLLTYATELQSAGLELLQLSVAFILTGLFFKLSAFPGHL
jgi:NADH-quinone oxidoreductase subunit N